MGTTLAVIGVVFSLVLAMILVGTGLVNFFDPWNRKEQVYGAIKLVVGILILVLNLVLMVATVEEENVFRGKCLSVGGVPAGSVCYRNGVEVKVDEEGRN